MKLTKNQNYEGIIQGYGEYKQEKVKEKVLITKTDGSIQHL